MPPLTNARTNLSMKPEDIARGCFVHVAAERSLEQSSFHLAKEKEKMGCPNSLPFLKIKQRFVYLSLRCE